MLLSTYQYMRHMSQNRDAVYLSKNMYNIISYERGIRYSIYIDTWVTCHQMLSPHHQLHTKKRCYFIDTWDTCHQLHKRDSCASCLSIRESHVINCYVPIISYIRRNAVILSIHETYVISYTRETVVLPAYRYVSHMSSIVMSLSSVTYEEPLLFIDTWDTCHQSMYVYSVYNATLPCLSLPLTQGKDDFTTILCN
jgi:hypothetical protein